MNKLNSSAPLLFKLFICIPWIIKLFSHALSILLKVWGIIDFDSREIWGYGLIFYGVSLVYISFGNNHRGRLFAGSIIFLSGLFLYIISKFDFFRISILYVPAVLLIFSISFFMLFIDNHHSRTFFLLSILFFVSGTIVTLFNGEINFSAFFCAMYASRTSSFCASVGFELPHI